MSAMVDDADYERLNRFKWYARRNLGTWYASRKAWPSEKGVHMHREIAQPGTGVVVDHRDGNGLNNQRHNLRCCSQSQNGANSRLSKANKIGFKGVFFQAGKWYAQIKVNRKRLFLGRHASPELAARAYDAAARQHFGEFARTNFP